MKGFGTDEKVLIKILSSQDVWQINTLREQYSRRYHEDLLKRIEGETRGNFEDVLLQIARGPLIGDCYALKSAVKGAGTKEDILDDILVGRSNADINAIKAEYQRQFHTSLEADLRSDLSAGTEQLFVMIVSARRNEDSVPVIPQEIEKDVTDIQNAIGNLVTKDALATCQIVTSRNDAQLRAIAQSYRQRFSKPITGAIKSSFTGHMEDTLILYFNRAQNRALADAELLEDSMAGIGTKNTQLIQRVVRIHWDKQYMQAVKTEYQKRYKRDLISRIKGETSGDYEKTLIACLQ